MNSDWSQFRKRITIKASPEKVYQAWTTRAGLESWFLRQAKFISKEGKVRADGEPIQAGDRYEWLWHGWSDETMEKRSVLAVNGKDQLRFEFSGDCHVTVSVKTENEITICELLQEKIPLDENPRTNLYVGCGEGWTFYLANLKSILEGGVDLRNKDVTIKSVVNS